MKPLSFFEDKIFNADCLKVMPYIPDKSIDMILCDLPYGTTQCKWDTIISFEYLWKEYKRIIKNNGAIVLTASQPFTSILILSNLDMFRYEWIWNKAQSGNARGLCKYQPLKITESICVFSSGTCRYYPQMTKGKMRKKGGAKKIDPISTGLKVGIPVYNDLYYPTNILYFPNCSKKNERIHPTQKPVELFEYLIRTYTQENEIVLDNCIGSGTTAIACINTNRRYIGIELDKTYFDLCQKRIQDHKESLANSQD